MDRIQIIIRQVKAHQLTEQDAIQQLEYMWNSIESNYSKTPMICSVKRVLSPEEIIIEEEKADERKDFLRQLFEDLSPQYKKVLWLYAVEQKTMREVGDELGISKQAVHTYLRRIRRRAIVLCDINQISPIDPETIVRKRS